jgi:hypothetical protein
MEKVDIFITNWNFCLLYGDWGIFWLFGIFSPVLVYCVKKNLANLFRGGGKKLCNLLTKQKIL